MTIQQILKEFDEIYPIVITTNIPINDFVAAANETLRMSDRAIISAKIKGFITSKIQSLADEIIKEIERMPSIDPGRLNWIDKNEAISIIKNKTKV